jgi:Ca2+-binding RTX toxin-like protein
VATVVLSGNVWSYPQEPWSGYDLLNIQGEIHTPTRWAGLHPAGYLALDGEGFAYAGFDRPTGGTIRGFSLSESRFGNVAITGLDISVSRFFELILSGEDAFKSALLAGDDTLRGSDRTDFIRAFAGNDTVSAAGGDDTIVDSSGANYLRGEDGNDSVAGGIGFDDINGNMGNDTAAGGSGEDWVVGGKDNDSLDGGAGHDLVYGNLGGDTCEGGDGNDIVRGGQDNDVVRGGAGNDYVSGDRGDDTMTGGPGADIFHSFGEAGIDRVTDFTMAEGDRVQLDAGTTYTVAQVGADTIISMPGGGQMILVGVQMSTLQPGWLII